MAIAAGTKAPDFTLKNKQGDNISDIKLSDNFGKKNTIILFFPLAFTGVCTQEMCDVSQGLESFTSLDATVYAISVDSPFTQDAWAQKEKITIPLLSDLNKKTAEAYGVLLPDLAGFGATSARAAFVVGKDGLVKYSEQTPTPKDLPDFNAIKDVLKAV
jgi:glutaredoxin-dependent peroxiredoxin